MKNARILQAAGLLSISAAICVGSLGVSNADETTPDPEPSTSAASTESPSTSGGTGVPVTATSADKSGAGYVFTHEPTLTRLNGPGLNDKLAMGDVGELDDASGAKIGVTVTATRGTRFTVPAGTPSIRLDDSSSLGFTVEPLPATVTGATGVVAYLDPFEHSFYGLIVTGDDSTVFPDDPATYTPATTGND